MKQRAGWKIIISEPAKSRIERNECPGCGLSKEKWTRRKDWACCSSKCTRKYNQMYVCYGWPDVRLKAFSRDNHTCVKCGKQPKKKEMKSYHTVQGNYDYGLITTNKPDPNQLIGDHIIPIALGGEEFNIDNVQTLCIACDKIKTKQDQGDIAKQRRIENLQRGNQLL